VATRAEKLAAIGNETKDNPNAAVLPKVEALHEEALHLGCHAGVIDHLEEIIFVIKRDIKQKEIQARTAENAPMLRGRSL
jgi:hypothetical protein